MSSKMVATVNNPESLRYVEKYVMPIIGVPQGTVLVVPFRQLKSNTPITVTGITIADDKRCITTKIDGMKYTIPISKISKMHDGSNRGLEYESKIGKALKKADLIDGEAAGCTSGYDFQIKMASGTVCNLELKQSVHCVSGQRVLHYSGHGWEPSPSFESMPRFLFSFQNAMITMDGMVTPLPKYINKVVPGGKKNSIAKGLGIYSNPLPMTAVEAYLKDKRIDVVHFDDMGTFGVSRKIPGLPRLSGECHWRIRGKHTNSITAQLQIIGMKRSDVHWNMIDIKALREIKRKYLGYR